MLSFNEPRNIFEVVYPFYCILKVLGYVPFSFKGKIRDGNLVVNAFDSAYFMLMLCGHVILFGFISQREFIAFMGSEVMKEGSKAAVFTSSLAIIISLIYQFIRRRKIIQFLRQVHEFDEKVSASKIF